MNSIKRTSFVAALLLGLVAICALPAAADQVILDDLIVDGSACIGQDCVNGESFGFDTLRLKENNLRVHFNDTSSSASFPTNDWRIRINDSSNGGASYYAIEDSDSSRTPFRIEAGAREHALYVDDGGRVGFGTNTPVVELHVKDGNTPTLRLEQDGSSGFTAQTFDVAANEANFFIRDVTNGSKLFFRAQPGAPQNSMYIASDGDVGLGTSSIDEALHVEGTGNQFIQVESLDASNAGIRLVNTVRTFSFRSNNVGDFLLREDGGPLHLTINGTTNAWTVEGDITANGSLLTSSREAKERFEPVDSREILAKVVELPISEWSFKKDDGAVRHIGPMAEDFHAAFALPGQNTKVLSMTDVNGITLSAIQGLYKTILEKEARIQTLEQRLAALEEIAAAR